MLFKKIHIGQTSQKTVITGYRKRECSGFNHLAVTATPPLRGVLWYKIKFGARQELVFGPLLPEQLQLGDAERLSRLTAHQEEVSQRQKPLFTVKVKPKSLVEYIGSVQTAR